MQRLGDPTGESVGRASPLCEAKPRLSLSKAKGNILLESWRGNAPVQYLSRKVRLGKINVVIFSQASLMGISYDHLEAVIRPAFRRWIATRLNLD